MPVKALACRLLSRLASEEAELAKPRTRWLYGAANVVPAKALSLHLLSHHASEDVSLMLAVARGDTRPLTRPREIRCRSSP